MGKRTGQPTEPSTKDKTMKATSIITAVLLGLGTAGVLAQEGGERPGGPRGPRGEGGPGGPGGPRGERPDPAEMFKRLDKDGDGKVSKEEAPERMKQNFETLDKNSDGFLTPDEIRRPGGGPGGPGGPGGNRPDAAEMFKRLDKNSDGKISKDEAPERMAQNFDKIDGNSDGSISLEELKAHRPEGSGGPGGPRGPRGPRPDGDQI